MKTTVDLPESLLRQIKAVPDIDRVIEREFSKIDSERSLEPLLEQLEAEFLVRESW
jgi:hypothetical protein